MTDDDTPGIIGETKQYRGPETDGVPMRVTVIGYQPSGTRIRDLKTDESWPGVKFHLERPDGTRFWSTVMPDKDGEYVSPKDAPGASNPEP